MDCNEFKTEAQVFLNFIEHETAIRVWKSMRILEYQGGGILEYSDFGNREYFWNTLRVFFFFFPPTCTHFLIIFNPYGGGRYSENGPHGAPQGTLVKIDIFGVGGGCWNRPQVIFK